MTTVDNPGSSIVMLQRYIIYSKIPFVLNRISEFQTKTLKSKTNLITLHHKLVLRNYMDD